MEGLLLRLYMLIDKTKGILLALESKRSGFESHLGKMETVAFAAVLSYNSQAVSQLLSSEVVSSYLPVSCSPLKPNKRLLQGWFIILCVPKSYILITLGAEIFLHESIRASHEQPTLVMKNSVRISWCFYYATVWYHSDL